MSEDLEDIVIFHVIDQLQREKEKCNQKKKKMQQQQGETEKEKCDHKKKENATTKKKINV